MDVDQLEPLLVRLTTESSYESRRIRDCIEGIIRIFRGALSSDLSKYQVLVSSQPFNRQVWQLDEARVFFDLAGIILDKDANGNSILTFGFKTKEDLRSLIELLCKYRDVRPTKDADKMDEARRNASPVRTESDRERELRLKARQQAEEEYRKCLEEKKRNREIAERTKKEIQADNEYRRLVKHS